jgi:hypothetical protein
MSENTPLHRAIELCLAVYRITDKFPREEILQQKLRTKSIDIIEDLVYNGVIPTTTSRLFITEDLEKKIRALFAYFSVVENQNWVDRKNFQVLRGAYRDFYGTLTNPSGSDPDGLEVRSQEKRNARIHTGINAGIKKRKPTLAKGKPRLSARQEKILGFLEAREGGQAISDIAGKIQASNKTAERELKRLIGMGRVGKHGNTRSARFLARG